MAATVFVRLSFPRRVILKSTCYSAKITILRYSTNKITEHTLTRPTCIPGVYFPCIPSALNSSLRKSNPRCHIFNNFNILFTFSPKMTCRHLSYSNCYMKSSDTNNTNIHAEKHGTKVDLRDCDQLDTNKPPVVDDSKTKLSSDLVLQDTSADFRNEFSTINEKEELNHDSSKMLDNVQSNRNNVSKHNASFEYDYQVAEDIEEYDYIDENKLQEQQVRPEKVPPISLERGKTGVFDLEELVIFLESLGAENIVTVPVPESASFCDHMVVVSAKSHRHLQAINDELLWVHKRKKSQDDPNLVIEGLDKSTWCAMDIGNIVLHVFLGDDLREYYDIESLWKLGPENDPKCQEQTVDTYALSPEDLFWLETGKAADSATSTANPDNRDTNKSDLKVKKDAVKVSKKSKQLSDDDSDSDADWGTSKH